MAVQLTDCALGPQKALLGFTPVDMTHGHFLAGDADVSTPFRVLAVGGDYAWAIVSGDATVGANGTLCQTHPLWLLSRSPAPDGTTMLQLWRAADGLGLDAGALSAVDHSGCEYEKWDPDVKLARELIASVRPGRSCCWVVS